ncbi:helix-turn-helix domain-containing protein [Clostridium cavendishii]|uniref:helix-turn-helix domain-containing protein n=1 Tax=Clostridium cavendishii TaxID=349931 RepID=UPI001A9A4E84|nr:helix-turn-helix transcriptional regulator [Clostridium cavendishii]
MNNLTFTINTIEQYTLSEYDTFGQRLRKLRKINTLTANKLAIKIGFTTSGILNMEHDKAFPSPNAFIKLLGILGNELILDNYTKYLVSNSNDIIKKWRKDNTINVKDAAKYFNIGENTYRRLEKTTLVTKQLFNKLENKIKKLKFF